MAKASAVQEIQDGADGPEHESPPHVVDSSVEMDPLTCRLFQTSLDALSAKFIATWQSDM
ncbi:Hypothetical predicted protein, partial [Pelobates cultripes]